MQMPGDVKPFASAVPVGVAIELVAAGDLGLPWLAVQSTGSASEAADDLARWIASAAVVSGIVVGSLAFWANKPPGCDT
eukprot:scaffold252012_cov47-Prasinocladus_malaysianus.AAC.1